MTWTILLLNVLAAVSTTAPTNTVGAVPNAPVHWRADGALQPYRLDDIAQAPVKYSAQ